MTESTRPDDAETDGGYVRESPALSGDTANRVRDTLGKTWALATREYRLAMRRRWSLGATLVFAAFSVAVVAFGASTAGPGRFDAALVSLVELGVYLVPLVALAVGYDAVVGPEASGSLALVRSLPAPAWTVVVGKYAGRAGALAGSLLVGFAPGLVLATALTGPDAVGPYAVVALAALLAACGFLALGLLVSTVARERTHALGLALAVWLWFVLLHELFALGAIAALDLSETGVVVAVLTNPAACFRVLALAQFDALAGGLAAAVREAGLSIPVTLVTALAWVVGPVALAAWLLERR
ncbi:ABC transporter permease [Halomicroarcula limicola]|uniref:ABC transporter permease n=1 Tax=Haloarcula limicola TaxID=1429915 RepID=A0A8J7Y713_9EURY|nr:ABC transporter permease subunit [Halomicroarcula limicola]MBV0925875.1 ABC transporter permease [Halomicroarcula limicola]